jgi:hypothetical protein
MIPLTGSILLPYPQEIVRVRFSNAGFLAQCIPQATCEVLSPEVATWSKPSPFAFARGTVRSTLRLVPTSEIETTFTLESSVLGGTALAEGCFQFAAVDGGTSTNWSATVANRTGILKVVPVSVFAKQTYDALAELWPSVQANWDRLPG